MQYINDGVLTARLPRPPFPTLAARFARAEASGVLRSLGRWLGVDRPRDLTLAELAIPDSDLARRATELARACEPPFLFQHSVRTYLFGLAIGIHQGLAPDRELLYLASVLHDLGLVPAHDGEDSFELEGARAAHAFLIAQGLAEERAARVHEAIALHTSVGLADRREPEVALTHLGAGLDVIGFHHQDVSAATRDAVVAAWPRDGLKERLSELIADQARRKPDCHIAGHHRLGLVRKIRHAPFTD